MFYHLFFAEKLNDWEEMMLHHIATSCLYFGYLFSNNQGIGAVIAFLHDIADIFVQLAKCFNSTKYNTPAVIFFAVMCIAWFYTRLVVLPMVLYSVFTEYRYTDKYMELQPFIYLTTAYLFILLFLHAFWFTLFIKIAATIKSTGTSEDLQQNVVANADDKKKSQ